MSGGVGADRKRARQVTAPARYPINQDPAPHARLADAGTEATASDWSDPLAASAEWTAACVRRRRLSTRSRFCPLTG